MESRPRQEKTKSPKQKRTITGRVLTIRPRQKQLIKESAPSPLTSDGLCTFTYRAVSCPDVSGLWLSSCERSTRVLEKVKNIKMKWAWGWESECPHYWTVRMCNLFRMTKAHKHITGTNTSNYLQHTHTNTQKQPCVVFTVASRQSHIPLVCMEVRTYGCSPRSLSLRLTLTSQSCCKHVRNLPVLFN